MKLRDTHQIYPKNVSSQASTLSEAFLPYISTLDKFKFKV